MCGAGWLRAVFPSAGWVPFQSENEEETVYRTAGAV